MKPQTTRCAKRVATFFLHLLLCILILSQGEFSRPAFAGWFYKCPPTNSQTTAYGGNGQGAAAACFAILFPGMPITSCYTDGNTATCVYFSRSISCSSAEPGINRCAAGAIFNCDPLTEWELSPGRCCLKSDPSCVPQVSSCPSNASAGNPVEIASGQKTETVVDFSTEGPRPLQFVRYYRSNDTTPGKTDLSKTMLGRAWRSNFDTKLAFEPVVGSPTPTSPVTETLSTPSSPRARCWALSMTAHRNDSYRPISTLFTQPGSNGFAAG
ncbi:MAG: hypothetical protein HC855_16575, partial [Rhizobiales bacterium]|nr:hypothetical protein [Hyphomicrobiales bacterium]